MALHRRSAAILLALLLLAPAGSAAQLVYDGGAPDGDVGFDVWGDFLVADDFELLGPTRFDAVRFWGLTFDPTGPSPSVAVSWRILHDDGAGSPGTAFRSSASTAGGSDF